MVKTYRYIRPEAPTAVSNWQAGGAYPWSPHNLGGVCFTFEFQNPGETLSFSYSICMMDDNFSFDEARKIADSQPRTTILYQRGESLINNVCRYLDKQDEDGTITPREKTLLNRLIEYGL